MRNGMDPKIPPAISGTAMGRALEHIERARLPDGTMSAAGLHNAQKYIGGFLAKQTADDMERAAYQHIAKKIRSFIRHSAPPPMRTVLLDLDKAHPNVKALQKMKKGYGPAEVEKATRKGTDLGDLARAGKILDEGRTLASTGERDLVRKAVRVGTLGGGVVAGGLLGGIPGAALAASAGPILASRRVQKFALGEHGWQKSAIKHLRAQKKLYADIKSRAARVAGNQTE